jgi:hypothetical protein
LAHKSKKKISIKLSRANATLQKLTNINLEKNL